MLFKQKSLNQAKPKPSALYIQIKYLSIIALLGTTAIALLLSLLSYNQTDPSIIFDTTEQTTHYHNWLSSLEHIAPAFCFTFLGYLLCLFPFFLCIFLKFTQAHFQLPL